MCMPKRHLNVKAYRYEKNAYYSNLFLYFIHILLLYEQYLYNNMPKHFYIYL